MAHPSVNLLVKAGAFVSRFFSEVAASVVMTACVAGATTLYLHYSASEASMPEKPANADIAPLLAPVPDAGAPRFLPVVAQKPQTQAAERTTTALPPIRPKPASKPIELTARRVGDRADEAAAPRPVEVAAQGEVAATDDLFAVPEVPPEAVAAFDPGPSAMSAADERARNALFAPPEPETQPTMPATVVPEQRREASLAASTARAPERRLLGMPVPDMMPSGEDVANRVKGWGAAVGSLIP